MAVQVHVRQQTGAGHQRPPESVGPVAEPGGAAQIEDRGEGKVGAEGQALAPLAKNRKPKADRRFDIQGDWSTMLPSDPTARVGRTVRSSPIITPNKSRVNVRLPKYQEWLFTPRKPWG